MTFLVDTKPFGHGDRDMKVIQRLLAILVMMTSRYSASILVVQYSSQKSFTWDVEVNFMLFLMVNECLRVSHITFKPLE